jgi:GntP family gluconate:H+ symporter
MELTSELARVLVVLAIGAGAMVVSHLNDSYFWVVAQFSGMETATALRTFSLATLLQGLAGMLAVTTLYYLLT